MRKAGLDLIISGFRNVASQSEHRSHNTCIDFGAVKCPKPKADGLPTTTVIHAFETINKAFIGLT